MDIKRAIDAIQELLDKLPDQGKGEQLQTFVTMKFLSNELLECAKEKNLPYLYIEEILGELDSHCRSIVDLEDRLGHPIDQHHNWARSAINKLKSSHCFKIK